VPALIFAVPFTVTLAGGAIASPVIVGLGADPVELAGPQVSTVPRSVPYAFAGLILLAASSYLVTLVAGADAAVTRSLLLSGGPEERLRAELTEVAASRARLAGAFEAERRRIERDLHDGAQQKLVALTMQRTRRPGTGPRHGRLRPDRAAAGPGREHDVLRGGRSAYQRRQALRGG